MADSIFDVEPPRWLQEIAKPIDTRLTGQVLGTALAGALGASQRQHEPMWKTDPTTGKQVYMGERGGSWFSNFLGAATEARMSMADPLWRIKANQLNLRTAANVLGLVETQADIDLKRSNLAEQAHDADVWPKWMAENKGNYLRAEPPNLQSTKYAALYNQFLARQTAVENDRITSYAVRDFYKRLDDLPTDMRYGVVSVMPQSGDPNFDEKFKAAQQALTTAETQATARGPALGAGSAEGIPLYSYEAKDKYGNRWLYRAQPNTTPGPVLTDWNRRMDWLRNADYESYRQFADVTTPPDTRTPEGLAMMNRINDVEGVVRARLEQQNNAALATPGANVTTTIGPGGLPTRSVTVTPPWQGEPPDVIQLSTGGQIIPKPVYSGSRDRVIRYDMTYISPGGQATLLTPQALNAMARNINDQISMAGVMTGETAEARKARLDGLAADRDNYNRLAKMLTDAQAAQLKERADKWKGIPTPLPPRGTNAPTSGGKTNYSLGPDGVLGPQ